MRYIIYEELYEKADLIMICRYDGETKQVEPDDTTPEQFANYVYTDQYVTPIKTVKGSADDSVPVRRIGGEKIDFVYSSDDPELQKGKSYLMFLREGTAISNDDVKYYKIIGGLQGYFYIESDGTLNVLNVDEKDKELLTQFYNSIK